MAAAAEGRFRLWVKTGRVFSFESLKEKTETLKKFFKRFIFNLKLFVELRLGDVRTSGVLWSRTFCPQEDQDDHAAEHRPSPALHQRDAAGRPVLQQPHLLSDHRRHGGSGDEPPARRLHGEEPGLQRRDLGGRAQLGYENQNRVFPGSVWTLEFNPFTVCRRFPDPLWSAVQSEGRFCWTPPPGHALQQRRRQTGPVQLVQRAPSSWPKV